MTGTTDRQRSLRRVPLQRFTLKTNPVHVALVLLASLAVAGGDAQAEQQQLVVVLPLETHGGIDPTARQAVEEGIRTIAGDELTPAGYTVLTGETTLRLLTDNGVDPSRACEASCALDAARELKARLFLSGSITLSEGEFVAFVRLFEGDTGRQLASLELVGTAVKEIRAGFREKGRGFFAKALQLLSGEKARAVPALAPPSGPRRRAAIAAEEPPPPTERLVVTAPEKAGEGAPGSGTIELLSERPGVRLVVGTDLRVATPYTGSLPVGEYAVRVEDECFLPAEAKLEVFPGRKNPLYLRAKRRLVEAVVLGAEELPADALEVDGEPFALAQGRAKVPACAEKASVRLADGVTDAPLSRSESGELTIDARPSASGLLAVRVGAGPLLGVLGLGAEFTPLDHVGLAVGTGTHALGFGASFKLNRRMFGGPYVDLHVVYGGKGFIGPGPTYGWGYGATLGHDFRPHPNVSVRLGIGIALNDATQVARELRLLTGDCSVGFVL